LLRLLDSDGAGLDQPLITLVLLLREGERRLRLSGLLLGLFDTGMLRYDLCIDVDDVGLGLPNLSFGLIDLGLEVAVVEAHQHGPGLDELVVGHRHVDNAGVDLRADRHRAGVDEGVIGRHITAGADPPEHDSDNCDDNQSSDREHRATTLAKAVDPGACRSRLADDGFCLPAWRGVLTPLIVSALVHDELNVCCAK